MQIAFVAKRTASVSPTLYGGSAPVGVVIVKGSLQRSVGAEVGAEVGEIEGEAVKGDAEGEVEGLVEGLVDGAIDGAELVGADVGALDG